MLKNYLIVNLLLLMLFPLSGMSQPEGLPPEAAELWNIQERMTQIEDSIRETVWNDKDKEKIRKCDKHKHEFLKGKRESHPEHSKINDELMEQKKQDPKSSRARQLLEAKFKLEQQFQREYEQTEMGKKCQEWGENRVAGLEKALENNKEYQKALKNAQILRKKLQ